MVLLLSWSQFVSLLQDGERRLYLAIEGKGAASINKALNYIKRVLREELVTEVRQTCFHSSLCAQLIALPWSQATTYTPVQRMLNPGKYKVLAITSGR